MPLYVLERERARILKAAIYFMYLTSGCHEPVGILKFFEFYSSLVYIRWSSVESAKKLEIWVHIVLGVWLNYSELFFRPGPLSQVVCQFQL